MKYQFVLSVWGEHYLDIFSKIVLPSLMTSDNLLGFSKYNSEFDIYTTPESKRSLLAMPILSALAGFMKIRITEVPGDDVTDQNKYKRMNYGHRLAIERSAEIDSVLLFLAPDAVFADGTLALARTLVETGKRAVLITGQRAASEPFVTGLNERFNPNKSFGMQIYPRQLTSLLLRHPHEANTDLIWGNKPFAESPAHILFPVADEGYILRGFLALPMAVYPRIRGQVAKSTIDSRWLLDAVPDLTEWHLITDSDLGGVVDVGTRPDQRGTPIYPDFPEQHVADWMAGYCDEGHHWMVRQNIYVHHSERSELWTDAEMLASATIEKVFELYEKPTRSIVALAAECERYGSAPLALFAATDLAGRVMRAVGTARASIGAIFDSDSRKHGMPLGPLLIRPPSDIAVVNPSAIVVLVKRASAEADIRRTIEAAGYSGRIICLRDL
jgi:hypothetical protein